MNQDLSVGSSGEGAASSATSVRSAKAGLLAWADATDARHARARVRLLKIVGGGSVALIGGLAVARAIAPPPKPGEGEVSRKRGLGDRLITVLMVARAGEWLVPLALKAMHREGAAPPLAVQAEVSG